MATASFRIWRGDADGEMTLERREIPEMRDELKQIIEEQG